MKPLLAGALIFIAPNIYADCNLDAEMFSMAEATGGSVQCADREYYRAINEGRAPVVPKGFDGNCVATGAKVICASGTLVEYSAPSSKAETPQKAAASPPLKALTFTPVNEPPWLDRPAEPGNWYGLSCLARIWENLPNDKQGALLMYRHGARTAMKIALAGTELSIGAQSDGFSFKGDRGSLDYRSLLSIVFQGQETFLSMDTRKVGKCLHDATSSCVRAKGSVFESHGHRGSDTWRISAPIAVFAEDSCAKNSNSYLLDARPFWYKLPIPRH